MSPCSSAVKSAMTKAIAETMENMAFDQVEEAEPNQELLGSHGEILWASLPIHKPATGEISIELSTEYARATTEALFGVTDGAPNDIIVRDALAEMLNTITGRFMAEMTPAQNEFELGLPLVGNGESPIAKSDVVSLEYNVGEHLLKVYISGLATGEDGLLKLP